MGSTRLVLGHGDFERTIENANEVPHRYGEVTGRWYHDHRSATPTDRLAPEDLAVTLLLNSQAGWRAFRSLQLYSASIQLGGLPDASLEQTSAQNRAALAELIGRMAAWPGFGASTATKVLHKKRPDLIPILDNQAVFGAYLNPNWPAQRSRAESIKSGARILEAVNAIYYDLIRHENRRAWEVLSALEPGRTRVQLFDSVWWMHFRRTEPVRSSHT